MKSTATILGLFLLLLIPGYAFAQFSSGTGTSGDPYLVSNATQLNEVRNNLSAYYIQSADIDLGSVYNTGTGWQPIGNTTNNKFTGSYNGDGHSIIGLFINRSGNYTGLFGVTGFGSSLNNVALKDINVIGRNVNGGLVGLSASTITNCYVSGLVSGSDQTGGLVGLNTGTINASYVSGSVSGGDQTGGLAGNNGYTITTSYATGTVTGSSSYTGGLVGINDGPITTSYATGSVSGSDQTGGLAGTSYGTITTSYATGTVTGSGSFTGGLIGKNVSDAVIDSYWNTQTTGQATSDGDGIGLTSAQMTHNANFMGFDFSSTWDMDEGSSYPYLQANEQTPHPAPVFAGGAGTSGTPYQVATATQLDSVRHHLGASFIQTADIDLDVAPNNTGSGWRPIGDGTNSFTGSYNGDGHTISGLFISRSSTSNIGLFGATGYAASLKNIGLVGVNVTGGNNTAGLVGGNSGTVSKSYVTGAVSGNDRAGGLVGTNAGGAVSQSYATGTVSGTGNYTGGLVGLNNGTLSRSYATGGVSGSSETGGLVGRNGSGATLTQSYATGGVSGSSRTGGLVGHNQSTVSQSYWDTQTTGQPTSSGSSSSAGYTTAQMQQQSSFSGFDFTSGAPIWGIDAGSSSPYLQANEQTPHPVPQVFAGGAGTSGTPYQVATATQLDSVRHHLGASFIQTADIDLNVAAYNTGKGWRPIGGNTNKFTGSYNGAGHTISGLFINRSTDFVGLFGFIYFGASLKNIGLAGVNITGGSDTGGLVGENYGTLTQSYTTGTVSGSTYTGGLAGYNGGTLTKSYAAGAVSGSGIATGGLVGQNSNTVKKSYATGAVSGGSFTGGLVGYNYTGTVSQSYATGGVSGSSRTGGLVGKNEGTLTQSYAAGAVSGGSFTGGLVGRNASGTVSTSYWDTETTGQNSSSGSSSSAGLTTAQMSQQTNFSGFDFTSSTPIWGIDAGYTFPYLLGTTHRVVSATLTGNEGWRMLSAPVGGLSYAALLDTLWTQGFPGADSPTHGTANVYTWDEATQQFTAVGNASDTPDAGAGFLVYVYDDQNYDGTPEGFPKTLLSEGEEDTSSVSAPLSYHSYPDAGVADTVGFNLVGNPYAATIDWDAAGWTKTKLEAPFYVWSDSAGGGAGAYLSWNGSTGTLPDGKIAPFQGFWVQANAAGPVLGFTKDVRSAGGVLYGRADSKKATKQSVPQLRFNLKENTEGAGNQPALRSQAVVMFTAGAKAGHDPLDAWKLASLNADYLSLYTTDTGGNALDINAVGAVDSLAAPIEVPMDFKGSQKGGAYTLSWAPQALPAGWTAKLTDTYAHKTMDLGRGGEYSFTVGKTREVSETLGVSGGKAGSGVGSAGKPAYAKASADKMSALHIGTVPTVVKGKVANPRFTLSFSPAKAPGPQLPQTLAISPAYPNPFSSRCNVDLALPKKARVRVEVYDILGRKVATVANQQMTAGYHTLTMDAAQMGVASGVYLCRMKVGDNTKTMKMTFIK